MITATTQLTPENLFNSPEKLGRHIESAVGAHLLNSCKQSMVKVFYWREGDAEMDFVLASGDKILGIEVKSGHKKPQKGYHVFKEKFPTARVMFVGAQGINLEMFLQKSGVYWLEEA